MKKKFYHANNTVQKKLPEDLITFTEEILNVNLIFCAA